MTESQGVPMFASPSYVRSTISLTVLSLCLVNARDALAIDTCKARIDKKTGVILVDATNVGGPLQWGSTAGNENSAMFNAGTCVASGKAKKCQLADPTSSASKTPPGGCTVYLDDGVADCSAWIPGCSPGPRASTGAVVKDSAGDVIGYSADGAGQFVIHDTGNELVRLYTAADGAGFSATGNNYYTSTDCTGTALLPPDVNMIKLGQIESPSLAYYGPATGTAQTINSVNAYLEGISDQAGCDGYFGPGRTFIPPHGCCWTITFSQVVGAAISVDLTTFTPPFSTVIP